MKTSDRGKVKKDSKNQREEFAAESGLAIVITDENASEIAASNNNSMCRTLYDSAEFAACCAEFCGRAFALAHENNEIAAYRCYAGLDCRAVPLENEDKKFVAIVGRTFSEMEDYRLATTRAVEGDWQIFAPAEFFENVLIGGSRRLEKLARRVENLKPEEIGDFVTDKPEKAADLERLIEEFQQTNAAEKTEKTGKAAPRDENQFEDLAGWRALFGSLLRFDYQKACAEILRFLGEHFHLDSTAWLENRANSWEVIAAAGSFVNQPLEIDFAADDARLLAAAASENAVELRERQTTQQGDPQIIRFFPLTVGGETRGAIIVADEIADAAKIKQIARFGNQVTTELEILRLRGEMTRRGRIEDALGKFNAQLNNIDAADFAEQLVRIPAEILRAENGSLLLFDEKSDELKVSAAVGGRAEQVKAATENIGGRVALKVLQNARPFIVQNLSAVKLPPADWQYQSDSFISYPLSIGGRKIGVLNFTDRADGEVYNELDLDLLAALAPNIAVAIDRAIIKDKAGEFEQLSVTDALTGLLNRRYLEERLFEEISRSNRHGYTMSFMMIDVDEFKSYNDRFTHPEGDKALKIVAQKLKENLRGADVAARYGGEEFSILLPQTSIDEAAVIADRIRRKIASTGFPNRRVTVSIGIAASSPILNTATDLIAAADRALYAAKHRGRNNVQIFENPEFAAEILSG